MYSNCCGCSSFSGASKCGESNYCCNLVKNLPANVVSDPRFRQPMSAMNFSIMPAFSQPLSRTISTPSTTAPPMAFSTNSKIQQNPTLEKIDENLLRDLKKSHQSEMILKKTDPQVIESHEMGMNNSAVIKAMQFHKIGMEKTKVSKELNSKIIKNNERQKEATTFQSNEPPMKTFEPYGNKKDDLSHNSYTKEISNNSSIKLNSPADELQEECDCLMENASYILTEDIFGVLTEGNVGVPSQSKTLNNSTQLDDDTCKCNFKESYKHANASNPGLLRNGSKKKTPSSAGKNNIKFNCVNFPVPGQEYQCFVTKSDTVLTNSRLQRKSSGSDKDQSKFPEQETEFKTITCCCPNFEHHRNNPGIRGHSEKEPEFTSSKFIAPSSVAAPFFQYSTNPQSSNPLQGFNIPKSNKNINESCTDNLNVICDHLLESVQNSVKSILSQYCSQSLDRMDELHCKLEHNEATLCQLQRGFREKMAEQSEKYQQHFHAILEFLKENEANKTEQISNNPTPTNSTTCHDKECQQSQFPLADPYLRKPNGKSNKYCHFAASDDVPYIPDRRNVISQDRVTLQKPKCKCCCCHVNRMGANGNHHGQSARNYSLGTQRFGGGGVVSNHINGNMGFVGNIKVAKAVRGKCCCGHSERIIMTSSICDKYSKSHEEVNQKQGYNINNRQLHPCTPQILNQNTNYSTHAPRNKLPAAKPSPVSVIEYNDEEISSLDQCNYNISAGSYDHQDNDNDGGCDNEDLNSCSDSQNKLFQQFNTVVPKPSLIGNNKFSSEPYISS